MEQLKMPFVTEELSTRARIVRSMLQTLMSYHRVSMALHNRPIESVYNLAQELSITVNDIGADALGDEDVQRYRRKFNSFTDQHGLVEPSE